MREIVKDWIIHYLTDRAQYVQIDSHMSEQCNIKCGVPTGFNYRTPAVLNICKRHSKFNNWKSNLFSDDTSFYISDANTEKLFDKANIEINKSYNWFSSNRLCLCARKIKYVIISSRRNKYDLTGHNVYINDIAISRIGNNLTEESIKFLGIYFDEYLIWKHHLKYVNNRISSSLFMIKQVNHILPKQILLTLC